MDSYMRAAAKRTSTPACFQDYVEILKPMFDEGFSGHMARLLGDMRRSGPGEGTKALGGGKRIRGSLLCLVAGALGGALESALPRAIAVELIQTATLIHDDFVDQHDLRRNLPAIWTLEGARKAVLLGDVIFASAIQMMSEMGRDDGLIVSRTIAEISLGAYREPMNASSLLEEIEPGRADASFYEKIIHLKTGVLFGAACQLGALAAGADEGLQQVWLRYGLRIGEAYQIADDLHEIERYLLTRSMTKGEMTSLAPALLFFAGESKPHIFDVLRRKPLDLGKEMPKHFEDAAKVMKEEIEIRLQSAITGIEGDLPSNEYGSLVRKTPWDIIQMFNETRPAVSWP